MLERFPKLDVNLAVRKGRIGNDKRACDLIESTWTYRPPVNVECRTCSANVGAP
jgi:hypothetical protein